MFSSCYSAFESVFNILLIVNLMVWSGLVSREYSTYFTPCYSAFENVFNILLIVNLLVWPGPRIFQIFYSLFLSRSRRTAPRTNTLLPPWRSGEKSATDSISRARKCKFSFFPFVKTKTRKKQPQSFECSISRGRKCKFSFFFLS